MAAQVRSPVSLEQWRELARIETVDCPPRKSAADIPTHDCDALFFADIEDTDTKARA